MDEEIAVTLTLSQDLLRALGRAAARSHLGPTDYLRQLMGQALGAGARAPIEERVRLAFALSCSWSDLQHRLREAGFVLRPDPGTGELQLCSWPVERPIMPLPQLGLNAAGLALRFGSAFPPDGRQLAARRTVQLPPPSLGAPTFARPDAA